MTKKHPRPTVNMKLTSKPSPNPKPVSEPTAPITDPKEARRPFNRHMISIEEITPAKFELIANRRFILCLPGLDSFLVEKVERPPFIRPKQIWQQRKTDRELLEEANAHKRLVVYLHEAVEPSTRQQVQALIDATVLTPACPIEAQIKMLDPVGTVVQLLTYHGVMIERVDYDTLDYASSNFGKIKLTLSYQKENIKECNPT